ncbi:centrosomal protein of 104 kDa-like isoform X2 [Lineus longissimus]|uniref:centrosomal protein of 104 kDa-like isoform X2 n=1 Tax=Lineus longissimus TaxID=88925 RepID=UPI00315CBDA4
MPQKIPFRVIHVSGQDDVYKAVELNSHSPTTRGWQSQRFCLYPQDLVIQLDERVRLRKIQLLSHQFLIPTKIEFYVGDVPDGTGMNLQNARYTRLGYVSVSDNEKTGYKARELKSVHVDAMGVYLKLVIHKNHVNKHNLYNQVGVIAINVIGDSLDKNNDNDEVYLPTERDASMDPVLAGIFNRPDYISPLDDLAFDMYQDPEVAQIIRKLERKKQEAVLQERYDYAKKLKTAITELQKVGERLGKYEVEKRQAVENEDYDKAKLKKIQMDEFRLQIYKELDIHDLLEVAGSRHPKAVDFTPRQPTPVKLQELSHSPLPPNSYDERPLPSTKSVKTRTPSPRAQAPFDEDDDGQGAITGEPEAMTEKDLREASSVIDVFGLPLVTKAYSKTWSFREDALLSIYKQMHELPDDATREDAKFMMRAAIHLVVRGIKDEVFAVFKAALNLLKYILTDFIIQHKIHKPETHTAAEKALAPLLQKTGNTAVRHRDIAKGFTLEMAQFPEVRPINVVPHECVKPIKLTMAPRLALSRTEIIHQLYRELTLNGSGLSVDNIMKFCTVALQHTAGEVREEAEKIIVQLYKEVGSQVKEYLPPDDDRTRKNVLYRQLFEAFDKIDGKPSKADLKKAKAEDETKKQKEIEALQAQLQQLKDMTSGKAPVDEKVIKEKDKPRKAPSKQTGNVNIHVTVVTQDEKRKPKRAPPSDVNDDDTSTVANADLDTTCIFCGEKNSDFKGEENLDLHYWKHCPMLKRCANCKQVVEIAGLTDHLLEECDAKSNFAKCPRCTEAIPKPEHPEHVREQLCPAAKKGLNHCPLCHENIDSGEDGWKDHLMGQMGCKQNPRRVMALEKNKGGNKAKPSGGAKSQPTKGRSNLPKPRTTARR